MKQRADGFLRITAIILAAAYCTAISVWFKVSGCVTARVGEEADWSRTSCPAAPTDIAQMSRVGEAYQEEWLAARGDQQ
jgi:hypothetical protein